VSRVTLRLAAQAAAVGLVAALLLLLVWRTVRDEEGEGLARAVSSGKPVAAPDFDLERLDQEGRLSLDSLRGRPAVINFWASWCNPCKEEVPLLEQVWQEHRDEGLVVLGVDSQDFRGDARRFARRNGMTYPIVHDGPGDVMRRYDLTGLPETYFLNRRGQLVCGHIIGGVHVNDEIEEKFRECVDAILRS
jgi:cytochrome c biogenesis protein CcmG, thiol:disulfide interchange protein DsbE